MPVLPKPHAHRRRSNPVAGVAYLDAAGRSGPAPKPETKVKLCALARAYWDAIWASPMATVYAGVDVFPLSRLVELVHERVRGDGSATADGEIRQLEDRFGISPLARRRLSWEITQGQVADFPSVPDGASIEERLRAVDDNYDPRRRLREGG